MYKHRCGAAELASGLTLVVVLFTLNPAYSQDKKLSKLPSGPQGPGPFGAYYTQLKYDDAWDKPWRVGQYADVVVRFDNGGHRFVFWRGTSYIPCWVTDTGVWYTDEFLERSGGSNGTKGCCEPMSDKQTRYSHVRILESNDARVRIHWRYAPCDVNYRQPFVDSVSGWGDWVDEYYTVYPDGAGVRHATIYTSEPEQWTEWQESIVINQPGTMPEDNIETDALTLANMRGESKTFTWTKDGAPLLDGIDSPNIQVVNLKAKRRPFQIVTPDGSQVKRYGGHGPNSLFNFWNHWPVAQAASDCTVATSSDKPSHSSLSQMKWNHSAQSENSRSKVMLHGMTDKPASELVPLAKSWLNAPKLELIGKDCDNAGYDQAELAYQLVARSTNDLKKLEINIHADNEHPAVNPSFVIRNWGERAISLTLDGKDAERGKTFRCGYRQTLEGSDMILWIKTESVKQLRVVLSAKE